MDLVLGVEIIGARFLEAYRVGWMCPGPRPVRVRARSDRSATRRHPSGMANGVSSMKRRRTFSQIRATLLS